MIELLEWFQQLNAHGLRLTDLKSESSLITAYAVVCFIIKRPIYLLAFFICYIFINAEIMQVISEHQVYLIITVIYSYVFDLCAKKNQKLGCATILLLSLTLAIDSFLYGANGHYGTSETFVYRNIESLALFAHSFFISTLIPVRRILNSLRDFITAIVRITANSDYMLLLWYTR